MKKLFLLSLLLLLSSFIRAEEIPPLENTDPAIAENFRTIYYNVDQMSDDFVQDSTSRQDATFNINTATITNVDINTINRSGVVVASYTAAGEITQPLQPSFLIFANAAQANQTGDDQIVTFPANAVVTEVYDQGSDVTSSTFTAPVTGRYLLTCKGYPEGMTPGTHTYVALRLVTSNRTYYDQLENIATNNAEIPMVASVVADMDANDIAYCQLAVGGSATTADISGGAGLISSYFSGSLLN